MKVSKKTVMSLLTFRVNVAGALLKSAPPPPSAKRGRPSLKSLPDENNSSTPQRAVPNPVPPASVRFDKYDHWPVQLEKGRCRNSGCTGYTRILCSKYELCLCLNEKNNSFKDYHKE
jgi:hypothetical protein